MTTDDQSIESAAARQYLTFRIGDEVFAVGISRIHEVLDLIDITPIPNTPSSIRGMINVRGYSVPVLDVRVRFGMSQTEQTLDTRIVILEVHDPEGERVAIGALADAVVEVTELEQDVVERAPRIGQAWDNAFIDGVGQKEGEFIVILNVDHLFSAEDLDVSQSMVQ